jgi:hypothetical protein
MNSLGFYFGPKFISVISSSGKKILNNIQISTSTFQSTDLEEKVPDEVKIVAIFQDELRRNKVSAKEAGITLSSKDLIVRTFEMPVLPANELASAINFEAKKYLPFRVEELVLDYQLLFDRVSRKNLVALMGIKKEALEKYRSIFRQLNMEISSIEYSAFSLLRLLKLTGVADKGVVAVACLDLTGEDEINFAVLDNGFPLFSRDITLIGAPGEQPLPPVSAPGEETESVLDKLKSEIRVSLDYYKRKFATRSPSKVIFISGPDYQPDLETFIKDMGLGVEFLDTRFLGKSIPFSLNLLKGYSASLNKSIKTKIVLSATRAKTQPAKEALARVELATLISGIKIEPKWIAAGAIIVAATFGYGLFNIMNVQKEIQEVKAKRPATGAVNPDASYEELVNINNDYRQKIEVLDNTIKKQLYLTSPLDAIPRLAPDGIWLVNFAYKKDDKNTGLILDGVAYLKDSAKELDLINTFFRKLKEDTVFSQYFKLIDLVSMDATTTEGEKATKFQIVCQSQK